MATQQGYRADIDGLRAIAVLAVIISHMMPGLLPGGFLGVDVFFVISGYLISSIIARQVMQGSFSFGDFYARRIKRLAPAFVVMLIVVYSVGWFTQLPDEFQRTGLAGAFGVLSISNLYIGKTVDYFAPDTSLDPLVHIWSLSIEEQFYLFFPAVLVVALGGLGKWKGSVITAYGALVALIVASFGYAWMVETQVHGGGYFSLFARIWELGIGALLGVMTARGWKGLSRGILTNATTIVALVGLLLSFIFITEVSPHPGPITLIPVFATAVLLAGGAGAMTSVMLSIKPMVWIGAISYSAYLWHQPAIAFYVARTGAHPDLVAAALLMIAVLGIAFVSWWLVETPVRRLQALNRRVFLSFVMMVMVVFLASVQIASNDGYPDRLSPEVVRLATYSNSNFSEARKCHMSTGFRDKSAEETLCIHGPNSTPKVLLWGDSHTASLASGFLQVDSEFSFIQSSVSGCFPAVGLERTDTTTKCDEPTRVMLDYLSMRPEIEIVVMQNRWHMASERQYIHLDSGRRATTDEIWAAFTDVIIDLVASGRRVVIVDPAPEFWTSVPAAVARNKLTEGDNHSYLSIPEKRYLSLNSDALKKITKIAEIPGVTRMKTKGLFCVDSECFLEGPDGILAYDDDHLSAEGAARIAQPLIPIVDSLLRK